MHQKQNKKKPQHKKRHKNKKQLQNTELDIIKNKKINGKQEDEKQIKHRKANNAKGLRRNSYLKIG